MLRWKQVRLLVIVMLAASLLACTAPSAPQAAATAAGAAPTQPAAAAAPAKAVRLAAGTGSAGSTFFILGNAIATLVGKHVTSATLVPEAAPSSSETVVLIDKGERALGLAPPDTVDRAAKGVGEFKAVYKNVSVLFPGFHVSTPAVVLANSGIKTAVDVKGKKVVFISSATEPVGRAYFRAYGLKDTDYQVQYLSQADQVTAIKEKAIDVAQLSAWPRSATLIDLAGATPLTILPLEAEQLKRYKADNPLYSGFLVPANTYNGQPQEVMTPANGSLYLASPTTVSEAVAYDIVKAVMENRQELIDVYPANAAVSLDQVKTYIQDGLITAPFHPGAKKYYKEKGLVIPDSL